MSLQEAGCAAVPGMQGKRAVILEDDVAQGRRIQQLLEAFGCECLLYEDGRTLLRDLHRASFDLFIIDWSVPHVEGPDIVRWIRRNIAERVPVLFVTSRDDEKDIIEALECGADDYMVKPIRAGELQARVRALWRRAYPADPPASLESGAYVFDLHRKEVRLHGVPVVLKPREYKLAQYLFNNVGRLLSRDQLMAEIWGTDVIESRTLVTHISQIRRKLALRPENGFRLLPVYSLGYRLEAVGAAEAEQGS